MIGEVGGWNDALVRSRDEEKAWALLPVRRVSEVVARKEGAPEDLMSLAPRFAWAPEYGVFLRRSWEYMEL